MARVKRALAVLFLATGVILVFAGLNSAVGVSVVGILSSVAAIAALLYSGAVWFGAKPADGSAPDKVLVYDRSLRLASGSRRGQTVSACFPASLRGELESRCLQALAGNGARFSCGTGLTRIDFDAVPVRSADGIIEYGLLIADHQANPAVNHASV